MNGGAHDCYVLVEVLTPDSQRLYGRYDVPIREGGEINMVDGTYRILEEGRDLCAAEWMRLHKECDRLREVAEVMES